MATTPGEWLICLDIFYDQTLDGNHSQAHYLCADLGVLKTWVFGLYISPECILKVLVF